MHKSRTGSFGKCVNAVCWQQLRKCQFSGNRINYPTARWHATVVKQAEKRSWGRRSEEEKRLGKAISRWRRSPAGLRHPVVIPCSFSHFRTSAQTRYVHFCTAYSSNKRQGDSPDFLNYVLSLLYIFSACFYLCVNSRLHQLSRAFQLSLQAHSHETLLFICVPHG